jgi:hypothetical protein
LADFTSVSGQVAVLTNDVEIIKTNYYQLPDGTSASNLAYSASTNAEAARVQATNAQAVADAALSNAPGSSISGLWAGPATNQTETNDNVVYFTW